MPNYPAMPNDRPPQPQIADASIEDVLEAFERFRGKLGGFHMPDFLGIDITMQQAKILVVVVTERRVRMSTLVERLGVSLSTISGHVDRLVEGGLLSRQPDPADRRQVVLEPTSAAFALEERFHELNTTQFRRLLDVMTPPERAELARAMDHLTHAVDRLGADFPGAPPTPARHTAERTTQ